MHKSDYGYTEIETMDVGLLDRFEDNLREIGYPPSNEAVHSLLERTLHSDEYQRFFAEAGPHPQRAENVIQAARLTLESHALDNALQSVRTRYTRELLQRTHSRLDRLGQPFSASPNQLVYAIWSADKEMRQPEERVAIRDMQLKDHHISTYAADQHASQADPVLVPLEAKVLHQAECYRNDVLGGEERLASARGVLSQLLDHTKSCDAWQQEEVLESLELKVEPIAPSAFQEQLVAADAELNQQLASRQRNREGLLRQTAQRAAELQRNTSRHASKQPVAKLRTADRVGTDEGISR
jgi:hypothetical protein